MKKIFLLIAVIAFIPFFANANQQSKIKGNEKVVKQERKISDFHAIDVTGGIDIILTQGNEVSLTVEADENLHPIIITRVDDGVLKIFPEKSIRDAEELTIHLTFKDIDAISATGGCDISSNGHLKLSKLSTKLTGGSDLDLDLTVNELVCTHTGGCDASFNGVGQRGVFTVTGGSDVEALNLKLEDCTIVATGGSDVKVNVTSTLTINASGSSDITYTGSPKKVTKTATGGSDIMVR